MNRIEQIGHSVKERVSSMKDALGRHLLKITSDLVIVGMLNACIPSTVEGKTPTKTPTPTRTPTGIVIKATQTPMPTEIKESIEKVVDISEILYKPITAKIPESGNKTPNDIDEVIAKLGGEVKDSVTVSSKSNDITVTVKFIDQIAAPSTFANDAEKTKYTKELGKIINLISDFFQRDALKNHLDSYTSDSPLCWDGKKPIRFTVLYTNDAKFIRLVDDFMSAGFKVMPSGMLGVGSASFRLKGDEVYLTYNNPLSINGEYFEPINTRFAHVIVGNLDIIPGKTTKDLGFTTVGDDSDYSAAKEIRDTISKGI
jgi:hypothetical protein